MRTPLLYSALVATLLLFAGCQSAERGPRTDDVDPELDDAGVRYHVGHPFEAATTAPVGSRAPAPEATRSVEVTFHSLERFPEDAYPPLAVMTRLIASPASPSLLLPASALFAGARGIWSFQSDSHRAWIEGGQAGEARTLSVRRGVLVSGTTATFEFAEPLGRLGERLSVSVCARNSGGATLLDTSLRLEVQRMVADPLLEVVLLEPVPLSGTAKELVVVLPPASAGAPALAVVVTVAPPPVEGEERAAHELACRSFLGLLERSAEPLAPLSQPRANGPGSQELLEQATEEGLAPAPLRLRLAELARARGAGLAYELALAGEDALLSDLAASLRSAEAVDGLQLERAALAAAQERLKREGAPEVRGVLVRYAGGVADRPRELRACAAAATDRVDLERRLIEANRALVTHAAPATRRRARAWLAHHPEGHGEGRR